ncbi:MAG: DUF320 domain-containing protein [Actinomycetales bacterium]|nr:DUF320 domain-containing protein [Actinomycetales bacterium]
MLDGGLLADVVSGNTVTAPVTVPVEAGWPAPAPGPPRAWQRS